MYSLTSYDLWKTTPPDDGGEAWEEYEDKYLAAATRLLVAHLTETLLPALTPRDRAAIVAQVRRLAQRVVAAGGGEPGADSGSAVARVTQMVAGALHLHRCGR